ncbi:hypothetical protein HX858_06520, partial [Marine Group I thaumarchaeote]|nr:hypothetical protein [Marine Group I thaumarchaeote]NWJ57388.1 hypothetical protein [Marine Group I thaumarchaeote]
QHAAEAEGIAQANIAEANGEAKAISIINSALANNPQYLEWLKHYDLERVQSHCSGHSKGQDLLDVVTTVNAKMLYPVHTEHPDAYRKVSKNMTIVEEGKKYDL